MEIASSGMATYGNSFQQVIGLVTSGTEIMQGRASQVARGLSTIAARIVKNQDALAEYGIQVEKTDGSLKSTFDVLSELKPKWDAMTDAQRVALGDTLAGQNQYKVLASVLQNFQHAIDATNTALESAGSATKENAAYMESLEAKENALKAEFEDFANRVLSKDVVKGFLEAGTSMLDFANNDVGAAISRIGLLATGMTGLTGIVGQTVGKIVEVGLQLKNLGVGGGSFLGMLASGKVALIVGGVVLAVTALVEVIRALKSSYDAAHPSFEQANENLEKTQDEISQTTDKLKEYKDQLAKLDEVAVEDRGAAWQSERSELELNIEASQSYLDILERIRELQGQQAYGADRPVGYTAAGSIAKNQFQDETYYGEYQATGDRAVQLSTKQADILSAQYSDQYQALTAITLALADATDEQYRYIEAEDLAELQGKSQEEQIEIMTDMLGKLGIALDTTYESSEQAFSNMGELANKTGELSQAQKEQAQAYIDSYDEIVKVGAATKEQVTAYVELAAKLNDVDIASGNAYETIALLANVLGVTPSYARDLAISMGLIDANTRPAAGALVQLENGTWAVADGLNAVKNASNGVGEAMSGISHAMAEVQGTTSQFVGALFNMNGELTTTGQAALTGNQGLWSLANAEAAANQQAAQTNFDNLVSEILSAGQAASWSAQQIAQMFAYAGLSTGAISSTYGDITTDKRAQMAYGAREFKSGENLQSYLTRVAKENLEKAIKESDSLQNLGQNLGYTTGGGGGSSKKSAEEKAAEEAEKQAKKAQKAQEKAAKQSQQAYESAAKSAEQAAQEAARAAEQAAEEAKQKILDSIQELKDASDDFWDSKTDAIEETNKELDRQKQLEEKLKALEEAKQKKIILYKNGQFQYDKDYGTIAKAKADYEETRDKIQRERELEQLEEMKDNATEIFNEMKDIISNGGDVTQTMINNWLSKMQSDGANYYDSNKAILSDWLAWAQGAIKEFSQSALESFGNMMTVGGSSPSGQFGNVAGAQTNGQRYLSDPFYYDENGDFVGYSVAMWMDIFEAQLKNAANNFKPLEWLGGQLGTNVFDDWAEVLDYWGTRRSDITGQPTEPAGMEDMLQRLQAAQKVLEKYRDVFESLGYEDYLKVIDKTLGVDRDELYKQARMAGATAHPEDPFGWRTISPADWTTTAGKLYDILQDITTYEYYTGSQSAANPEQRGTDYTKMTIAGDLYRTAAIGNYHKSSEKKFTDAWGDYFPGVNDIAFDPDKLERFRESNEEVIKQLQEMWFEAQTETEKQAIHLEAEARRQARDYAEEILGIESSGKSDAERAANRQAGGTVEARRQEKKNSKNIESIEDTLQRVSEGQAISDEYINSARDYIVNALKENREISDKLYSDTEKAKIDAQTSQMKDILDQLNEIQRYEETTTHLLEGEETPWAEDETLTGEKATDWLRDEEFDKEVETKRAQMLANAEAWWQTTDEAERKRLHEENVKLAEQIGGLTYTGSTGTWSKNATGTRNFRGGLSLVGERGPELRVLKRGDNIIPANQTANLWKWSNTTPQQMLTTLSARSGGSNTSYTFDVSRIELPNVTDAKSFVQGLKNYALQYSYKR